MIWSIAALVLSGIGILLAILANKISHEAKDAARKSADEARKSRLDNLASTITILDNQPQHSRWMIDAAQEAKDFSHPMPSSPMRMFHVPKDFNVRILVGTILTFANEGVRTARVEITANRIDDITTEDAFAAVMDPNNPNPARVTNQSHTVRRDGVVFVPPRERRQILIRSGPSIEEWLETGPSPTWSAEASIVSRVAVDGAFQRWTLAFSAQILTTNPQYLGQVSTVAHSLINAELTELPLGYPDPTLTPEP